MNDEMIRHELNQLENRMLEEIGELKRTIKGLNRRFENAIERHEKMIMKIKGE